MSAYTQHTSMYVVARICRRRASASSAAQKRRRMVDERLRRVNVKASAGRHALEIGTTHTYVWIGALSTVVGVRQRRGDRGEQRTQRNSA